jgi:DNA-binding NtrC family response regulator
VKRTTVSERALVLAPRGRDAAIAVHMLTEAGLEASVCTALPHLIEELNLGAAFVVMTEEAIATADLHGLAEWLSDQENWSDLPFILVTDRGGGLERNPAARRHLQVLGNVTFLERPFHPTTLVSLAQSALRARRRQYEARARLIALRESEARFRTLFDTMDEGFCVIEFLDGPHGPLRLCPRPSQSRL